MESESKPTFWNVDAQDFIPSASSDFTPKQEEHKKPQDKKKPYYKKQQHKKKNPHTEEKKHQNTKDPLSISIIGINNSGKTTLAVTLSGSAHISHFTNCQIYTKDTKPRKYIFIDTAGFLQQQILPISITDYSILAINVLEIREPNLKEIGILLKNYLNGRLIVALTHVDQINWDHDSYNTAVIEVRRILDKCGVIDTLCVPIGGNINIIQRVSKDYAPWYSGKTLIQILDTLEIPQKKIEKAVKVPIFGINGNKNDGYLGKVLSGNFTCGTKVMILPNGQRADIVNIKDIKGGDIDKANAGEIVSITLKTPVDNGNLGLVLCEIKELSVVAKEFRAEVIFFNLEQNVVSPGFSCQIHLHSIIDDCVVVEVISVTDIETKAKVKLNSVRSDQRAMVVIQVNNSVCAENCSKGWDCLSKFSLVLNGKVVGVGKIVELHNKVEEVVAGMGF
ncbi:hypothetical protein SteCoe_1423 [Stentor coeruleus]|uniref:Tr-type G domain-containing protein n=1 Tax=Stentor coeruleus TaxID=5963 RepID=A0A1R2D1R4_9CILI|nr:hypothetical protein SteCoe_1423 [Stentor coeruleus]